MYCIGDKVIHPGHGGCVVDEISTKSWNGQSNEFYILHPLTDTNTKLMVPINNASVIGLHHVIASGAAEQILGALPGMEVAWINDHKERQQSFGEAIKGKDLMEMARVVKTLLCRESQGKMTNVDRELLNKGRKRLYSELALSLGRTYQDVEDTFSSLILPA